MQPILFAPVTMVARLNPTVSLYITSLHAVAFISVRCFTLPSSLFFQGGNPDTAAFTLCLKGRCWSKNCFAHFSTYSFHCAFIMISMKKYGENNDIFFSPRFVSMEMVAIFDFRALTKVHITLKPLLQMK